MEKVITISGKNYKMKASAMTQFIHKNDTGRSFLSDLQLLTELEKKAEDDISALDNVTELVLRIAYTMTKQADKEQYLSYEDFVDSIDNLYDNVNWIQEVIEFACSPISRQLQKN